MEEDRRDTSKVRASIAKSRTLASRSLCVWNNCADLYWVGLIERCAILPCRDFTPRKRFTLWKKNVIIEARFTSRETNHFVDQRVPYRLTLANQQLAQTASYRAVYFSKKKKKKSISEREESVYLLGYCLLVCSKINFRNCIIFRVSKMWKREGFALRKLSATVCAKLKFANRIADCDILKYYFAPVW